MFDTEKFIYAVKSRPLLYNTKVEGYKSKDLKERKWQEIGAVMFSDWSNITENNKVAKLRELDRRWKSIRSIFMKELRQYKVGKAKKKRKFIFYNNLKFLVPILEDHKEVETLLMDVISDQDGSDDPALDEEVTKSSVNIEVDVDDEEETPSANETVFYVSQAFSTNDIIRGGSNDCFDTNNATGDDLQADDSEIPPQTEESTFDMHDQLGNEAFLMSLLPLLNKLPFESVVEARIEIMHTVQKYASIQQTITDE